MADDLSIAGRLVALDEVTIEGATKLVPRDKVGWGAPNAYNDVADADGSRLPVDSPTLEALLQALLTELGQKLEPGGAVTVAGGTYGYAAGTAAATVDVPAGARVKRVSVIAGSAAAATVTIAGGATITIPAGGSFDEQIPGDTTAGADVVIGGTVTSYYVGWVA